MLQLLNFWPQGGFDFVVIIEPQNRNYLRCSELISEFDPFLADDMRLYENCRIKEKREFATFLPFAAQPLYLVDVRGFGCISEAVAYFQFILFYQTNGGRGNLLPF